jgi:hypothetical protein
MRAESTKFLGTLNTELVNENIINVEEAVVVPFGVVNKDFRAVADTPSIAY